jgi:chaperonin GroES
MEIKLKPIGDRILVEPAKTEEKIGRIFIPDAAKEKPQECTVVALGHGRLDSDGKRVPFEVKAGDRVLVSKYGGSEIKFNGVEYRIVQTDDIMAILS